MHKIISLITLSSFAVSTHRKRIFILTVVLLAALLLMPQLNVRFTFPLPYTVEVMRLATLVIITNIIANIIRIFVVSNHRKRRNISGQEKDNFTVGVNAVVNAATVISFIIFFFIVFDIEFRSFLNSIALFAVALTLIFIDFIKNFLYGLVIMFSNDYEIGDYIQVGETQKGVILTLTFSSVHLKTESGDLLFIPNALVRSNQVVNFNKLKPKRINSEFTLLRTQIKSVDAFEQGLVSYLETLFPNTFEMEKAKLRIIETNNEEVQFNFEVPTRKASLVLKEKVSAAIQKFSVEYSATD